MTLLAAATVAAVVLLAAVLVVGLVGIGRALEAIGGAGLSYMGENMGDGQSGLARVRWGLRAIERHTAAIGPGVGRLNELLGETAAGLTEVEEGADGLLGAVTDQRRGGGS